MKILVTGLWFPLGTNVVIRDTFRRMGHTVITAGPCFGDCIPWAGMMVLDGKKQLPDAIVDWDNRLTISDIEAEHGKFDLVVQCDSQLYMDGATCPNVCYACDNHVADYPYLGKYDIFFGSHSWGVGHEHKTFSWLPGGWEPHAVDLRLERRYDVCIVGSMYEQRMNVVKYLLTKNVTILLGWGRLYEEWNYLYNLAKMTVVEPCNNDVSGRVFNHFRQGTLVIMPRGITDIEKMGIKDMVHYLGYDDEYEMWEQVQRARDSYFRETITGRAKAWVVPHSWDAHLEVVLKRAGGKT